MRTNPLNGGGGEELNRGRGSVIDSNFLCLEYDSRVDQEANEMTHGKGVIVVILGM